jgi:Cytidylate kinase-like family
VHGGSHKGISHVLKVRVISSLESLITSAMPQQGCSRAAAIRSIQQVDAQRQRRMRYLFDVDWRGPALYDLVVNLEDMRLETAADMVVYLAQHPEYQPTPASAKALTDLTLSSRVEATLAVHGIEAEVRADDSVVWVVGVVDSGEVAAEIRRVVQMVRGVKEVIADLDIKPVFPYSEV